jgi:hypothetical protein
MENRWDKLGQKNLNLSTAQQSGRRGDRQAPAGLHPAARFVLRGGSTDGIGMGLAEV